jgi:hypothetical protein
VLRLSIAPLFAIPSRVPVAGWPGQGREAPKGSLDAATPAPHTPLRRKGEARQTNQLSHLPGRDPGTCARLWLSETARL